LPSASIGCGYGGVSWLDAGGGDGNGGAYGLQSYGGVVYPPPLLPILGGYGGDPYGLGSYGSLGTIPPQVTSVLSLNGYDIQVFFSEDMDQTNPALIDPSSYRVIGVTGAPSTVVSVQIVNATSVVFTHSGTTLGGSYTVAVAGPTDLAGNPVLTVPLALLAKGEVSSYSISTPSARELLFSFGEDMLEQSEEPPGTTHGILDASSYVFSSTPEYPVELDLGTITHPYGGDASKVHIAVRGMTSLQYLCNISPAQAIEYDGTILPSAATTFVGSEVGTGTSQVNSGYLWMSKGASVSYGWEFLDSSARIQPGDTSFRVDVAFNSETVQYVPPLSGLVDPQVSQILIEDGPQGSGVQVKFILEKISGVSTLSIQSGTYSLSVEKDWDVGTNTIILIRNKKAGIYAVLWNGSPLISVAEAQFTGAAQGTGAGVYWTLLDEAFSVTGFQIREVDFSASQTVWTGSWNFCHDQTFTVTGSGALAKDEIFTQRGPLVKDWGDATPATNQDVKVYVQGVEVAVSEVNPYIGLIKPTVPIPLFAPADNAEVKVDYKWFANPLMEMGELNTEGLVLNQWSRPVNHHNPPAHGEQFVQGGPPTGAPNAMRFPYRIVLGPVTRPTPLLVGQRYMGFEREYSAMLNSPTTLILNQNPNSSSQEAFERNPEGVSVAYEGTKTPITSSPIWILSGTDSGEVEVNQGTYVLEDAQSGSYDPDDPQVAYYWRGVDLTFPSSINIVGRFQIEDASSLLSTGNTNILSPDGVFTGVGFGIHNNQDLYLVGALLINNLEHVGVLLNARKPQLAASWSLGPQTTATITTSTTMSVATSAVPLDFKAGGRFQILAGTQTGVYTATSVVAQCDDTTTITVSSAFPADYKLFGNNSPEVLWETPWSGTPSTYRLVVDPETKTAVLTVSGSTTAQILSLTGSTATVPLPAETSLILSTEGKGQVFWGSLSRRATNRFRWSFYRYGVTPDQNLIREHSLLVTTEMDVVPEDNPTDEWFITQAFGYSKVDETGEVLILKSTSQNESLDFTFGYKRIEPFFTQDSNLDSRFEFKVESGVLGAGDAEFVLNDGLKEVRLSPLMWIERPGQLAYRVLIDLPVKSFSGILDPTDQGWALVSGSTGSTYIQNADLSLIQDLGETIQYQGSLDLSSILFTDDGGRILEGRFAVDSHTVAGSVTGIFFEGDIGAAHHVKLRLKTGVVQILDINDIVVQEFTFAWDDGEFHTYRIVATLTTVSLFLDDEFQSPSLPIASFAGAAGPNRAIFGAENSSVSSSVRWRSFSYSVLPPTAAIRTLGVYLGGDRTLIDNWEIPRTDTTTAPNSYEIGPVIEEMDWRSYLDVRLLRTPGWGVTVYRPDLPLPPYYVPETAGVPGSEFATLTTEPSAGWINVEYSLLPRVDSTFGFIAFGSLNSNSVTQQRWDNVRYRLFKPVTDDWIQPQHMVLNHGNVVTSGERTLDTEMEEVIVRTLDTRRVSLKPAHLYADQIWKIVDGSTIYTYESWTFDKESQLVTLGQDSDGNELYFSGSDVPVTLIFEAGTPVTNTYLQNQPLLDSVTLLNQGTPPVPKSQTFDSSTEVEYGTSLNDPVHSLNDPGILLNDPYKIVTFTDDPTSPYQSLDFIEVDNDGEGDLLSSSCDDLLPQGFSGFTEEEGETIYDKDPGSLGGGSVGAPFNGTGASADLVSTDDKVGAPIGAHVLDFSGPAFWDSAKGGPDFNAGSGQPGDYLFASGGNYAIGGTLGPGSAVLYPNHALNPRRKNFSQVTWGFQMRAVMVQQEGSVGQDPTWVEIPLTETMSRSGVDNTPPSLPPDQDPNPDGAAPANGYGAALAVMTIGGIDTVFVVESPQPV